MCRRHYILKPSGILVAPAMHHVSWLGKTHRRHHARRTAQGVLLEYAEYVWKLWWLMWPPFMISVPCGFGWLVGTNVYAVFSAFAHQLQHENPTKCFWLSMPIHFVHHAHNQWHHNFGVTVDIWDHVFGTYKQLEWQDRMQPKQAQPGRRIWQINWLWGGNAVGADVATRQHARMKLASKCEGLKLMDCCDSRDRRHSVNC